MAQQTMTEKEVHLAHREREHETTRRVLKAFPQDQASFRPHPTSMTALETAWMMVGMVKTATEELRTGTMEMTGPPPPPKSWKELIAIYEKAHEDLVRFVRAMPDDDLNRTMRVPVAKDRWEDVRRADVLWWFLHALIHHRAQLSVYLRAVGGRVPAMYGPSGDETWQ